MKKKTERGRKKPEKNNTVYAAVCALAVMIVLTVCGWRYYVRTLGGKGWEELQDERVFDRHYVLITEDPSSLLWQDLYESAKEEARQQNACLELLGAWDTGEYSLADYMNIAIAAQVDGILVKPDGSSKLRRAIDAAGEAGIPVVTLLEDESLTSRKSFVGINSYQMGTVYGQQILQCIRPDTKKVTVLQSRGDAEKDLVYKQLKATVQEGLEPGTQVEIASLTLDEENAFEAEEVIRDLFRDQNSQPDILVCMNETHSACAYYAMVDYNQVGSVQLIGFYQSESMLNAVQKGIVPRVITLDTEQAGRCSIEALDEYYRMGYASNYFSVDLSIITEENVGEFLQKDS